MSIDSLIPHSTSQAFTLPRATSRPDQLRNRVRAPFPGLDIIPNGETMFPVGAPTGKHELRATGKVVALCSFKTISIGEKEWKKGRKEVFRFRAKMNLKGQRRVRWYGGNWRGGFEAIIAAIKRAKLEQIDCRTCSGLPSTLISFHLWVSIWEKLKSGKALILSSQDCADSKAFDLMPTRTSPNDRTRSHDKTTYMCF